MSNNSSTNRESVKDYYGKVLSTNEDLKTSACCVEETIPDHIKPLLAKVHDEVMQKFYGCGSPLPEELEGKTVLDLGSGSGRDCYVLSQLVGENGRVIGVDMTDEQLGVANRHVEYHREKFGYAKSNVEFRKAYIEDLKSADIADNSVDVIVSNCVLNLSLDKPALFKEIFRVLKPGGELYFSDVFTGQRVPEELKNDPVLLGECLSGAMYLEDFRRQLAELGVNEYRVMAKRDLALTDSEVFEKIGMIDFYSMTIRAFKLDFEDRCEDYGQVAYYKGSIGENPHFYTLDNQHTFKKGQPLPICGNTAEVLTRTRFAKFFEVIGDRSTHLGPFQGFQEVKVKRLEKNTQKSSCC